jgi:hypothetical protein
MDRMQLLDKELGDRLTAMELQVSRFIVLE